MRVASPTRGQENQRFRTRIPELLHTHRTIRGFHRPEFKRVSHLARICADGWTSRACHSGGIGIWRRVSGKVRTFPSSCVARLLRFVELARRHLFECEKLLQRVKSIRDTLRSSLEDSSFAIMVFNAKMRRRTLRCWDFASSKSAFLRRTNWNQGKGACFVQHLDGST